MKNLVVLGNGFDLFCDLKSKYSDFFSYRYLDFSTVHFKDNFLTLKKKKTELQNSESMISNLKSQKKSKEENITFRGISNQSFKQLMKKEIESDKELIDNELSHLNELEEKYLVMVDEFVKDTNFSLWDYLFMLNSEQVNAEDILWSDVEKDILNTLMDVDSIELIEILHIYINSKKYRRENRLITMEQFFLEQNYDDIYDFLLKELNLFENSFKEYLIVQTSENKSRYQSKAHELFKSIVYEKTPKNANIITSDEFYVINFNYTRPFSNLEKRRINFMNNVHGSLFSDEIIFGIDGFSELPETLNFFTKTSRIMSLNIDKKEAIPKNQEVETIYFFGHSFSEADYSYFLSIFDYYDIYSSNVKLCYVYTVHSINAKINLLKSINSLMNKYGESFDNKAKGKNLMHKLNLENRLVIKEI